MFIIIGSLTGWNFEYFDQPDDNGYEVRQCPLFVPVSPCECPLMLLLCSGTRGSILLLELEDAALTITESSARLVDRVTLTVAAMDNILKLSLRPISLKPYLPSLLLLSPSPFSPRLSAKPHPAPHPICPQSEV